MVTGFLCHDDPKEALRRASLEVFAARVVPEFKERHEARGRRKAEELGLYIEGALARGTPPPAPGEPLAVQACGRDLMSGGPLPPAHGRGLVRRAAL